MVVLFDKTFRLGTRQRFTGHHVSNSLTRLPIKKSLLTWYKKHEGDFIEQTRIVMIEVVVLYFSLVRPIPVVE